MNSILDSSNVVVKIVMHGGGVDSWKLGKQFSNYKVMDNALIFMDDNEAWIGWYNLDDVKMWYITDHV